MKIGISWDAYGKNEIKPEEQIELLEKYGFGATFIDSDNRDIDTIVPLLREAGISVDTCHAPFKGINRIWSDLPEGDDTLKMLTESVDVCARHSIPVAVVHLSSGDNAPSISDACY